MQVPALPCAVARRAMPHLLHEVPLVLLPRLLLGAHLAAQVVALRDQPLHLLQLQHPPTCTHPMQTSGDGRYPWARCESMHACMALGSAWRCVQPYRDVAWAPRRQAGRANACATHRTARRKRTPSRKRRRSLRRGAGQGAAAWGPTPRLTTCAKHVATHHAPGLCWTAGARALLLLTRARSASSVRACAWRSTSAWCRASSVSCSCCLSFLSRVLTSVACVRCSSELVVLCTAWHGCMERRQDPGQAVPALPAAW